MLNNLSTTSLSGRIHSAFTLSLKQRCEELHKIIKENSLKDLHGVLTWLLEVIFGNGGQLGWDIGSISKRRVEYDSVRWFLSPGGPLLSLVHKLVVEGFPRYEFPVSALPGVTQACLSEGSIPVFFTNKLLQPPRPGTRHKAVAVDAFELYFFHFASHLIHNKNMTSPTHKIDEVLYHALVDDYLSFYLPLNDESAKNAVSAIAACVDHRFGSAAHTHMHPAPAAHGGDVHRHSSYTLVQVLVDFWLRQHSYDDESSDFTAGRTKAFRHIPVYHPLFWRDVVFPSTNHVRILRLFVKHLHYFNNTVIGDASHINNNVGYPLTAAAIGVGGGATTALAGGGGVPVGVLSWFELKRYSLQIIHQPLYMITRFLLRRWPLDASFRLILELWLSYIQPWRYVENGGDKTAEDKEVHPKWASFIQDNILFYTTLYQNMLPQIFRMDLTVPKNSYMLFRVTKVFDQLRLRDYIHEAEMTLCDGCIRMSGGGVGGGRPSLGGASDLGATYIPPTPTPCRLPLIETHITPAAVQHLEPHYTPLFSENTVSAIRRLLHAILQARHKAAERSNSTTSNTSQNTSLLSWFASPNSGDLNASVVTGYSESYTEDYLYGGGNDVRKLDQHLKFSIQQLAHFFMLDEPVDNKSVTFENMSNHKSAPDYILTDRGPKLTPLGRYQVINNIRRFDIQFEGDPELQPIRSYECAWLARFLYHLCTLININYSEQLRNTYNRNDLVGGMSRHILQAPLSTKTRTNPDASLYEINTNMSIYNSSCMEDTQYNPMHHQPRVTLRWLASYQNIGYILGVYLLMYTWCGINPISFLLLGVSMVMLYLVFMALLRPIPPATTDAGNVTLIDNSDQQQQQPQ